MDTIGFTSLFMDDLWMIYGIDRFQTPLQRQYVHHFMDRHGVYKGDVPLRTTR